MANEPKKKKKTKWIKFRHRIVRAILYYPILWYTKHKYKIKIDKFKDDKKRPYLILFNHQTAFDQFFVSLSFSKHVYYVSSEDLFSKGWLSRLISWLVAPIPFRKSTSDIAAIKNCIRVAREGGNIGMAPEGNRTYSGTTEHMKPTVASMAKVLKLPIALYRIEGGYGTHPRWSDTVRRGKMHSYVSRVVEPEEYKAMTDDELFRLIRNELYVDESHDGACFYGKKPAEFLDRAMYYCPFCGLSAFHSENDVITCTKCHRSIRYLPDKTLEGIGEAFPYHTVKEWYDAQCHYIANADLSAFTQTPVYADTICFRENIYCKNKVMLSAEAAIEIFSDRIEVHDQAVHFTFSFAEISAMTVLGKNKLNIYSDNRIFQCSGDQHFNALKYLNIYYASLNIQREDIYGKFLGL